MDNQKTKTNFDFLFTTRALSQIFLIIDNDYTLENKFFRIQISGKGCSGFDYACGFDQKTEKDFKLDYYSREFDRTLSFIIDPFTAFYFFQGSIDYQMSEDGHEDGFVVLNTQEEKYQGKFFKDQDMLPPLNH